MITVKEIYIKNQSYYVFDYIIKIKSVDLNKIKVVKNSCRNIFIYHVTYVAPYSVKPLRMMCLIK